MLEDLETAVQTYAEARAGVTRAEEALTRARAAVPVARQSLAEAIVAATLTGARQRDVIRVTGYSREQIRRILRAGGVVADGDSDDESGS